ncbi:MAG: 1-(5-phosphoribosyl)-5-[(5-phosphoribosylamino)methylideneamino]imidazole-4-carboxamide isomerase [Rikenellaceae bacterium]|nr:1-(5-phosphoribosyl)-5-[(5-phosphoribosylamino)methylideneamino]imidazole-4-carboxamide isomerase [Rikenellaceae bacterium]
MITVIPAIDIIGGECVRLTQGDYDKKTTYYKDPLDAAKMYEDLGVKRLHLVDLDGAKKSYPSNLATLEKIAGKTNLSVQYGGGIKSGDALKDVFNSGASRAICGSITVSKPELFSEWLEVFGPEKLILGADVKDGKIAVNGWLDYADMGVGELIGKFLPYRISQVICTDISRDGMLSGPNFDLYGGLQAEFPSVEITVSGGIGKIDDIYQLDEMGLRSVITGKAIYENKITLNELEKVINN